MMSATVSSTSFGQSVLTDVTNTSFATARQSGGSPPKTARQQLAAAVGGVIEKTKTSVVKQTIDTVASATVGVLAGAAGSVASGLAKGLVEVVTLDGAGPHEEKKPNTITTKAVDAATHAQPGGTASTCPSTPPSQTLLEPEVDAENAGDPQHVLEYLPDIYRLLMREEALLLPRPGYMEQQQHVNTKMRAILVDWLVDVHKKYKLQPETLFLAVNLCDRYLSKIACVARAKLQLVGVTAMFIAAKYEEMYPPQVRDFVYVTDRAYTADEVLQMEVRMLTVLDFQITVPTAIHFLQRYQHVNGCDEMHRCLVSFLLELTLTEYSMIRYAPSHLAAAALLLSNKLLRRRPSWSIALVKQTKMGEQTLKGCAKEICALLELSEKSQLTAVRKKYSHAKLHSVATLSHRLPLTVPPEANAQQKAATRRGSTPQEPSSRPVLVPRAQSQQLLATSASAAAAPARGADWSTLPAQRKPTTTEAQNGFMECDENVASDVVFMDIS